MPYDNDSAIIEIRTTADGYYIRAFLWTNSPPPVGFDVANALEKAMTGSVTADRLERVTDDKTELKSVLSTFVDNRMRTPQPD